MAKTKLLAYAQLHTELQTLARYYVKPFPVRASPSTTDLRRGDDYMVAAHAVVQQFIETACRKAVQISLGMYRQSGAVHGTENYVLRSIIGTHFGIQVGRLPAADYTFTGGYNSVKLAIKWYVERLDGNNGVRRSNLLALLLPLGFEEQDFDEVWLGDMNSFGGQRGDIAHGRQGIRRRNTDITFVVGATTEKMSAWSNKSRRLRNSAKAPWDVEKQIDQLVGELREWDIRLRVASGKL